jgi:aryl-alcohol dehydrogenase-like predicted oxidoreductase
MWPAHTAERKSSSFDRQLAETRALLGNRLDLYQVHSITPDSTALTDATLHRRLARLAADGVIIGLSTSGPEQGTAIRAALELRVDGVPLFRSVQATWNLLEPAAGAALAEAQQAGCLVIVKETPRQWSARRTPERTRHRNAYRDRRRARHHARCRGARGGTASAVGHDRPVRSRDQCTAGI